MNSLGKKEGKTKEAEPLFVFLVENVSGLRKGKRMKSFFD